MKVSVIVPVYNVVDFLDRCVNSLVNQSLTDIEVILVDDSSTDGSDQKIRDLERQYPEKLKSVFLNVNSKQGAARNAGLEIATGKYISFVDSDDWIDKDMLLILYQEAERSGADIVDCNYNLHNGKKLLRKEVSISESLLTCEVDKGKLLFGFGRLWTKIFRRDLYFSGENGLRFAENIFYEDNYLLPFLVERTRRISKVNEELYYYFVNMGSTTRKKNDYRLFDRMVSAEKMIKDFKTVSEHTLKDEHLNRKFIELYSINTILQIRTGFTKLPEVQYKLAKRCFLEYLSQPKGFRILLDLGVKKNVALFLMLLIPESTIKITNWFEGR